MNNVIKHRELVSVVDGIATSDGDGVKMKRLIGSPQLDHLDPFLLLDAFGSDQPNDYIGGFPSHPHRGFETVTYLLEGRMRHKDNAGHEGVIEAGGVQWMTAGKGIVHSEMPEQENGLLKGFQLWVNLPAQEKMTEPGYQEFSAAQIPVEQRENGTEIRVIAGSTKNGTTGPVKDIRVDPLFLDVRLQPGESLEQAIAEKQNAFLYAIEGEVLIGQLKRRLRTGCVGILDHATQIRIEAAEQTARFLLVSAMPLDEPIARAGPFVMNTREEIMQAFDDFRNNRFQQVK